MSGGSEGVEGYTAGSGGGSELFLLFCKVTSSDKPYCDLMTKLLKEFKHLWRRILHHQPSSLCRRYFSSRRKRPINIKQHKRILNWPFIQCWKLVMCHIHSIRKILVLEVCVMDDVLAITRCANQGSISTLNKSRSLYLFNVFLEGQCLTYPVFLSRFVTSFGSHIPPKGNRLFFASIRLALR
jgi:hypothetical protein